jgi:glycerol-3-phosphate acyltransferase PlsY
MDALPMPLLLLSLGAYLVGAVPFGLVLVKVFRREDVRAAGSGNIGATNVTRVAGRALGAATLALDALKGAAPVVVARALDMDAFAQAVAGSAAFLGHCFPVYLRFHGGKGIATGMGAIAGMNPAAAGLAVAVFGAAFAVTRISSVSCIAGMLAVVALAAALGTEARMLLLLVAMSAVSLYRLSDNIRRLVKGRELKF